MVLRELSIDVVPILTGAGIAGLAIGFGAQNLVRDVISGFFLILEDQVRVGDLARINGVAGSVEQINLRTIVLRDGEGGVQVFPNGTITRARQSQQAVRVRPRRHSDRLQREHGSGDGHHARSRRVDGARRALGRAAVQAPLEVVGIDSLADGAATITHEIQDPPAQPGQGRQRAAAAADEHARRPPDPSVFV